MYKAVITTNNELMHFNKNHSHADGKFISGDGDGDGVVDDHHEGSGRTVNYTSQNGSDVRKTPRNPKKMNPAELNKYGSKQIKRGVAFFATGIGLELLGKTAMVVSEDYGLAVGGAAFLTGLGLQVSGVVQGIKGAVNKGKARDMEFNERYYREHQ